MKFLKVILLSLIISFAGSVSLAFTIPQTTLNIGDPVYIENTDPEKFYAVFLPFVPPTDGEVCASMSGEELGVNNNLRAYGTCFINDAGVFTLVEISDPFSSSYEDLVENESILQEATITLNGTRDGLENKDVITNLEQFIIDAEEDIKSILSSLTETNQSTESTSSEESILGARSTNILAIMFDNYIIIALPILLALSSALLIYILKKDWKLPKDKR